MPDSAMSDSMYGDLTETYLQDTRGVLADLEDASVRLWLQEGRAGALEDLAVLTHRLRGTAALYGHPQTATLAGLLERLLEGRADFPGPLVGGVVGVLECAHTCLTGALDRVAAGLDEGPVGLEFTRLGGAAGLSALLRAYPAAFRPVASGGEEEVTGDVPFAQEQAELWSFFAPEARELIETLRAQLAAGGEDLGAMFRAAHTLKGSAAMVGLSTLQGLGHTLEDLLGHVREGGTSIERAAPLLEEGLALAGGVLAEAAGEGAVPEAALRDHATRTQALVRGEAAVAAASPPTAPASAPARLSVRVEGEQLDAMLEGVGRLVTVRARLSGLVGRQRTLADHLDAAHTRVQRTLRDFEERYLNPTLGGGGAGGSAVGVAGSARADAAPAPATDARLADFSALELDTYSDLNVLARSLTELSADLAEIREGTRAGLGDLGEEVLGLDKVARGLRSDVSRARRTPLSRATAPLHRWARERGGLTLHAEGEDLSIDAAAVPPLAQALLHLVTNAATHGLEPEAERVARGKPPTGTVRITARAQGGQLHVTVEDNGRGLPLAKVRERALAAGLAGASELRGLSDAQLAELVFVPGLSTAGAVTHEAGRGVGMDAVRSAVEGLGGRVSLHSVPGQGTTVTLHVPLTQQIAGVLVARVGQVRLALLADGVRGLRPLEDGPEPAGADVARVDLHALWGQVPGPVRYVARLEAGAGEVEVIADEFTHLEEVVLRSAGPLLGTLGYLAGTAVGEDGTALPVLDPSGLPAAARRSSGQAPRLGTPGAEVAPGRVLLVDDSLSVRRHLGRALGRAGFTVLTASDGREALDRLIGGERVDVVLTDLEMPRANGFEVLQGLRGHTVTAGLPVVVMTTRTGEKHQQLALDLGADDYFAKPADERRLARRLGDLIAGGRGTGGRVTGEAARPG
ncbi:Hpt domain-containing protein [Deinococcus sp. YIM 134068]|uniref:Hpt domain-containing protein n=1 Tax=Deinococcus lichenicola TaxID=3118910 RepID=UPI002F94245E